MTRPAQIDGTSIDRRSETIQWWARWHAQMADYSSPARGAVVLNALQRPMERYSISVEHL